MIRNTLIYLLIFLLFQRCNLSKSNNGIWKNDQIGQDIRNKIKVLNDKLFYGVKNDDLKSIKSILSDSLFENSRNSLENIIGNISSSIKSDKYFPWDEYFVRNSSVNVSNTISSGETTKDAYILDYFALNFEMYVSLLLIHERTSEILITCIYGNYGGEWKLNILQFGKFKFYDKSAMDFYQMAKYDYSKGYLIDAANSMLIANACLTPAGKIFQYKNEKQFALFYDKVTNEVKSKYELPLILKNIFSQPEVFNIYPLGTDEGIFPMVQYLTKININDSILLKKENQKVKKEVNNIFYGINKGKKWVFYQAFNELPEGSKRVDHFGFVDIQ
jgi:hypothetical protein